MTAISFDGPNNLGGLQIGINYGEIPLFPNDTEDPAKAFQKKVDEFRSQLLLTDPNVDREALIHTKGERAPGTCHWIRKNGVYTSWLDGEIHFMSIYGGPGKGKTILSIFVLEELEERSRNTKDEACLFYFCTNQDDNRNNAAAILRSLISQILEKQPDLYNHIPPHFNDPFRSQSALSSPHTLWDAFQGVLHLYTGKLFCVLDGLDECDNESIRLFVEMVRQYFSPPSSKNPHGRFSLMILGRRIAALEVFPRVNLELGDNQSIQNDIQSFISHRIQRLEEIPRFHDIRNSVKNELLSRSNGTFLWVGFVMNELERKTTCTEIMEVMGGIPSGLPSLYNRILRQIESRRRPIVSKMLRWVMMASRPLRLRELAAAIPIHSTPSLSGSQIVLDYISLCGNILQVHRGKVYLIHQSVKDYLLQANVESDAIPPEFFTKAASTHYELAKACIQCIEMSELCQTPLRFTGEAEIKFISVFGEYVQFEHPLTSQDNSPLLQYAVFHWPEHARSSSLKSSDRSFFARPFFENRSDIMVNWWMTYRASPYETYPLQMAACFGIKPWVEETLSRKKWYMRSLVNKTDILGNSALGLACLGVHEDVVKLLIEMGAKTSNDKSGGLVFAALQGNLNLVELLLRHAASPNQEVPSGLTALLAAVTRGHEDVVQILLDWGADVNRATGTGISALIAAADLGQKAIVKILVDRGAEINQVRHGGDTALHRAAFWGQESVVKLLAQSGADIDQVNNFGDSALNVAAFQGHESIVELLAQFGAKIDQVRNDGHTALTMAAGQGHESIVKILSQFGAEIERVDNDRHSALTVAESRGHESIVKFLAQLGADLDRRGKDHDMALEIAIKGEADTKALLNAGADAINPDSNIKMVSQ
ncbi:hypothetical protein N7540_002147 [Penicillium herquei]|nr:hypothetical protein N7540_002147 [Penicillium herquei]